MVLLWKKICTYTIILCVSMLPIHSAYGQNITNLFESSVEITLSPENPGTRTPVTATLITNSFDINAAFIAWSINGKIIDQGIGKRSINFRTNDNSQLIILEVVIQDPTTGSIINRNRTIVPAELDIIWESQGYTPPFYEGKSQPVLQSQIIFTAIPHVSSVSGIIPANEFIYTWHKNKRVLQESSGYGQNTIIITQDFLSRPFTLDVTARTRDEQIVIEQSVTINPSRPRLVFYEEDPLLGFRLEKGITDTHILQKEELWLRSVPYFIDTNDRKNGLFSTTWRMNGENIKSGPLEERVTFRRPGGSERGIVDLSVSFENSNKTLQSLEESFSILIQPLVNTASQF